MKRYFLWFVLILLVSCKEEKKSSIKPQETSTTVKVEDRHIVVIELQRIIDSAQLKGSVLLYNLKEDIYYSNDFTWARIGKLPASTYKIPNSIIALETTVVKDENTVFKWNGEKRFLKSWEEDLTFKEAFRRSCVPCYQNVARQIGEEKMNQYLSKFKYGNIQVDAANIDMFWLQGNSRITQFQQIDFLTRFYQSKLSISERTTAIIKDIMIVKETENYVLRGKTGWSVVNEINNGWFVGYIENEDQVFFFATNVEPSSVAFDQRKFQKSRKEITYKALAQLNILF